MKLIWAIIPLILFGIGIQQSFADVVYTEKHELDFENCEGILDIEEIKSVIMDIGEITVRSRGLMPVDEEPGLQTMCNSTFESLDKSISMTIVVMESSDTASVLYEKNLDSMSGQDFEIREYLTFWNNFDVVLNDQGLGSFMASQYDRFFISFHTSFDEDNTSLIDVEELRVLSTMVQKKILDLDDVPISPPNPLPDNDVGPSSNEHPPKPSPAPITDGKLSSPKKQVSQGIDPVAVKCNEGLVLLIKHNGSPACVRTHTAEKLFSRGWAEVENTSSFKPIIKTGVYAGHCIGYCTKEFTITPEKIIFSQGGQFSGKSSDLFEKTKVTQLSQTEWNELIDLIDFKQFNSLPDKIGCPGCADAPVEWIEISYDGKTKKIEFEHGDKIPEISKLIITLQEIRDRVEISIDSFEECVSAGNSIMESYPRQCRTSDGKHFVEEIDTSLNLETNCTKYGGKWLPGFNECENISEDRCSEMNGTFKECESACRHNPDAEMCTMQCVLVCKIP